MTETHDCPSCGRPVTLEVPEQLDAFGLKLRKLAALQKCDQCIDAEVEEDKRLETVAAMRAFRLEVQRSGLPQGLRELTFEDMRRESGRGDVIDAAKRWCDEGGSFFLYGRPGPGKTRLAATCCWHMLRRGGQPRFVQSSVLLTKANAEFGSDWREEAMRVLLGKNPLFLDDIGKEPNSGAATQILQACLDERISNGQHLFVTSNLLPSELGAKHGDWLASRLGAMPQYEMPGPDMRLVEGD